MKTFKQIFFLIVITSLASCNNKGREKPDVSNINADLHFTRFDKDLLEFRNKNFAEQKEFMQQKYGSFYDFYVHQFITGNQPTNDTSFNEEDAVKNFLADGYISRLHDSINYHFSNTKKIEEELTQSFKYFKFYFPEISTPKTVTINSGFSIGAFTYDEDVLGIGLDLYLGAKNPDYDSAGIYQYVRHKMRAEYIPRNAMEVLYNFYFGEDDFRGTTLIEAIAEKGKKMYFLSYVLPESPDSLLLGFTQAQTEWCEKNEYAIWKFMNDKDILYKNDYMNQKRYLDEAPSTAGMPPEAPGSIGNWIGLQIVRKFMKETGGNISLHDLITKYDGKTIFEKSKYRPAKSVF